MRKGRMLGAWASRCAPSRRSDGRTVAYAVWGDPDGFPVLGLHGTPGLPARALAARRALRRRRRVLRHARPRRLREVGPPARPPVADEVDDVRAIADELGFERFGVTGGSGGGPHALACAALLPERVVRAACLVGVAPFGPPASTTTLARGTGPREREGVRLGDGRRGGPRPRARGGAHRDEGARRGRPVHGPRRLRPQRGRPRCAGRRPSGCRSSGVGARAGRGRRRRLGRRRPRDH